MGVKVVLLAHCRHPIGEPFHGGLEMHTALLAEELTARGHAVTLVAKQGSATRARVVPLIPSDVHPGMVPGHEEIADQALADVLPELDADVIINNSLSVVPYLRLPHRPVLTLLHTPATLERVLAIIGQPAWQPPSRHIWAAVSQFATRSWSAHLPVRCVPNGIDLTRWAPHARARPRRRHAVWTGRITPEKGLHLAVDAVRLAGFTLAISGPIADQRYFDSEIVPRLGPDVHYAGHLDHQALPRFLQSGSVYVFSPLWPEPFGLALLEALACGTPAAALPHGAVAEILTEAGGAISTEVSADALAAAILEAAGRDRTLVASSVRRFDKEVMVEAYEQLLTELVARPAVTADLKQTRRTTCP